MTPLRIHRRRTRGWVLPVNTVCVTRPGFYGNPFRIGGWFMVSDPDKRRGQFQMLWCETARPGEKGFTHITTPALAVEFYEKYFRAWGNETAAAAAQELGGKNLACWCKTCPAHAAGKPFDVDCTDCTPCHTDILGRLVNGLRCEAVA